MATSTRKTAPPRSVLSLLVAALAFATSAPLAKVAVGISPSMVAAGRTAIAALAIASLMPIATLRAVRGIPAGKRSLVFAAGALLALHFGLFQQGLAHTSLAAAVALVSLEPLCVVLAAWVAFGIRPTRVEAMGVMLATAGAVVVGFGAGEGEHRLAGDMLVLGAVVTYGAYVALARGLRGVMPILPYAAVVYAIAATLTMPLAIVTSASLAAPPAGSLLAVIGIALVPTFVGHTLMQRAARTVAPSIVALVPPGETIGSILIGVMFMNARPSNHEIAGAALVIAGATIAIFAPRAASDDFRLPAATSEEKSSNDGL